MKGIDCQTCTVEMQKVRGCKTPLEKPLKIGGFETFKCPRKHLDIDMYELIEAYYHFQNGRLPFAGTWLDQPAKIMLAIQEVGKEITKYQKEENISWSKVNLTS